MQTVTLRRTLLVLALGTALLLPGSAMAAPGQPSPSAAGASGPSLLQGLWGWLAALWDEAGALIDPFGNREGAEIDPYGDRLVPLWGEEGAEIDPFGNHSSTPASPPATDQQEAGAEIDPFGAH